MIRKVLQTAFVTAVLRSRLTMTKIQYVTHKKYQAKILLTFKNFSNLVSNITFVTTQYLNEFLVPNFFGPRPNPLKYPDGCTNTQKKYPIIFVQIHSNKIVIWLLGIVQICYKAEWMRSALVTHKASYNQCFQLGL